MISVESPVYGCTIEIFLNGTFSHSQNSTFIFQIFDVRSYASIIPSGVGFRNCVGCNSWRFSNRTVHPSSKLDTLFHLHFLENGLPILPEVVPRIMR